MNILGTGLTGLVGSRITELLGDIYTFEYIDRTHGIDIQDKEEVINAFSISNADIVFHFAAKTDVDSCEKDKDLKDKGEAWKVNVNGTQNIAEACQRFNKKLLYISTDFVFDGENTPSTGYTEDDTPNPKNWYARTKYEAEQIVSALPTPWLIIRIAFPYRAHFKKNDFVRAMLSRLEKNQVINAIGDQIFTPTFIDDIALVVRTLIDIDATGIYHVGGADFLSPFEAALDIAKTFNLNTSLVNKTSRAEFFTNRAFRPFNLSMKSDKIKQLGIEMRSFKEGLQEIKKQRGL